MSQAMDQFPNPNIQPTLTERQIQQQNARINKWRKMMPDIPRMLNKQDSLLKSRLRKGIPPGLRMLVWPLLAEVDQMKQQAKRTYKELIESKEISPHDSQITLDVTRTFQHNELFRIETITSQALYKVLRAISLSFHDMGYCQGLNYLTAVFLLQMNDEMTFWHIYSLLTKYKCISMYINPVNIMKQFYALGQLIKKFLPEINAKFTQLQIDPFLYAAEWYITLFSSILPTQLFLRIMDIFWFENIKVIFRASLAILKIRKEEILNARNLEQVMAVLKDMTFFRGYDQDDFIKIAMKDFIFSRSELENLYKQHAALQKQQQ